MKRILTIISFILLLELGVGIGQEIQLGAAISYGGPIPTQMVENSTGAPLPGGTAGLSVSIPIKNGFSFVPGLYYSFRGLDYGQQFTRDTLITLEFNGISGQVPSFYTANVNGKMRIHYLDIPLLIAYRIGKMELMLGPYLSILVGGKDEGDVRVVIGTGGVFDDYLVDFDNYPTLRKMEQGIMLGSNIPIYKKLGLEMKATRSFFTLYDLDKLAGSGQEIVKMYNTYMQVGLVYKL